MNANPGEKKAAKSPLLIIFTTVLVDLIGFGIVIPLVALYGRHFGATAIELAVLGAIYSTMQFFFAPFWGTLSDRIGRRPVLLVSLLGSTTSYAIFAFAPNFWWLLVARAFGGIFAANISTAQAYIADVTTPADRAKGMGLIGAAFGIGFTLGPPIGGIAAAKLGIWGPGTIASVICGLNFLLALVRLPESLPPESLLAAARGKASGRSLSPINFRKLRESFQHHELWFLFLSFFAVTFAFSNMEQTFSLLFQQKFQLSTGEAGLKTGMVLMASAILGAIVQGGLIRSLVPRFGERKLFMAGLAFQAIAMALFPFGPTYASYFLLTVPMALGSGLINPSLSAMTSKSANAHEQGAVLGMSQGLGSLARATGPFCGLLTFAIYPGFPYFIATAISLVLLTMSTVVFSRKAMIAA